MCRSMFGASCMMDSAVLAFVALLSKNCYKILICSESVTQSNLRVSVFASAWCASFWLAVVILASMPDADSQPDMDAAQGTADANREKGLNLQEESDAQYKAKGKKGKKADVKSTADAVSKAEPASTTAVDTSAAAPSTDADKDVEMTDAPSSSGDKKHVGEMTGRHCTCKSLSPLAPASVLSDRLSSVTASVQCRLCCQRSKSHMCMLQLTSAVVAST